MKRTLTAALIGGALALLWCACALEVDDIEKFVAIRAPYISVQPESASYAANAALIEDTLTVEVWDWPVADGDLSFKWYTFDALADYIAGDIDEITVGVTAINDTDKKGSKLTLPAALKKTAGSRNYFFVEITNNNAKAHRIRESVLRSELVSIVFSGANEIPLITKHPADTTSTFGRSLKDLTVTATLKNSDPEDLTYQWYYYNDDEDGDCCGLAQKKPIAGANEASMTPNQREMVLGSNYFVAEVINGLEKELSLPANIVMEPGVRALPPRITVQPKDVLYFLDETILPLSVEAESDDFGALSYQWYRNSTRPSVEGAGRTAEAGAVNAAYTPPINKEEEGTFYYYVVVTNTNNNVRGTKTATVTSKPVIVRIANSADSTVEYNTTVTIANPKTANDVFNYVRGYGGMDVAWANFPNTTERDTELMYNPDTGLGYNLLRIQIPPSNANVDISMNDLVNSHRPDYYKNVKVVNKYGGYVLASPWSPPKEWKSNNSINGGGHLIYGYRRQYADYLRNFAQHMLNQGAPIYAISIQNEPNYVAGYDGCEWTGQEMADFYRIVGHFTDGVRGFGGGVETPVVLTCNGESANTPNINLQALQDPLALQNVDMFARHVYGEQTTTLWNVPQMVKADGSRYEVWMTEHNINSASATGYPNDSTWNYVWRFMNDIDLVMRLNNENAFVWWASKRFYSMIGDGQFGTRDGAALPRGYGLSHYAKYTPGSYRVSVTVGGSLANGTAVSNTNVNSTSFSMDNTSARITAYAYYEGDPVVSEPTEITMVMWTPTTTTNTDGKNMGTMRISLPDGFVAQSATGVRSTRSAVMQQENNITLNSSRTIAYVTLGSAEMLSLRFVRQMEE